MKASLMCGASERGRRKTVPASCTVQGDRSKPRSQGAVKGPGGGAHHCGGRLSIGASWSASLLPLEFTGGGRLPAATVPLRVPTKLLPGRSSASWRPHWACSSQQPGTFHSSSHRPQVEGSGEESAGGLGGASQPTRWVGFPLLLPFSAGGGSRKHW